VSDIGDPVAHRLVDGVLQRARTGVHAADSCAQELHPEHVERLPLHVVGAHVDVAVEAEQRAHGRRGDAVLAGAGFGDHAALAHALGEQRLPEGVVDLVGAGVREVLALEEDAGPPERLRQTPRLVKRGRAPDVVPQQTGQGLAESGIAAGGEIRPLQFFDRRDKCLRHEPAAVDAVIAACVRISLPEFWVHFF
jgi:hypothetical protein